MSYRYNRAGRKRTTYKKKHPEKRHNSRNVFTAYLAAARMLLTKNYPAAVDRPNCVNASKLNKYCNWRAGGKIKS